MDELQADESQEPEEGAELATAPEEQLEEIDDVKTELTEKAQKAINKQHAKFREAERKALKLEEEKKALEEKLSKLESGDVTIPPLPDPYDEDFDEKIKLREDAIAQKAKIDAQKQSVADRQEEQKKAAEQAEQEREQELLNKFNSRIVKLGLEPSDVGSAVNKVVEYGISRDLGEFILQHDDGPLITKYLADNPIELDELRSMSPISAAMKIESEIKQAAATMKPQASSAPDPAEVLTGRGAGELESPLIKGATFE